MIHYHGGPITPERVAIVAWRSRHAMVSFANPEQLPLAAEIAQSFALDNGAFSAWTAGRSPDWCAYADWVQQWRQHPGYDWHVIPDVIDGDERANDELLEAWPLVRFADAVPVWHLHESLERLQRLATRFHRVALGSSGQYATVGVANWWQRMAEAMEAVCDEDGRPRCKLHGLRMLDPTVFSHLPLASADSTNVARNIGLDGAWRGTYTPATKEQRAMVMIDRIEAHASAARWCGSAGVQRNMELLG